MIPIDDPLKCVHAEEWDSKTLEQAVNSLCWSNGIPLFLSSGF